MQDSELLKAVDSLKATMVAVATGGPRIQNVQREFGTLYDEVATELDARGIENTIPYRDLWDWYGRWSSGDLPTYQSRRSFINEMFAPIIQRIQTRTAEPFEPTGWTRVDRTVTEIRNRLASAETEEHFQAVGLLCREVLISAGQAVFDPDRHPSVDGVKVSRTDAKRMLEGYLASVVSGSANEYVRKHARAAIDLAVHLQHKRTATFRDAAICVEATTSVVNLLAIISGQRDPG
jgi:hypothetical protein